MTSSWTTVVAGAAGEFGDIRYEKSDAPSAGIAKLTITGGVGPFLALPEHDRGGVGVELARVVVEGHRGRIEHRRSAASKAVRFVVELPAL